VITAITGAAWLVFLGGSVTWDAATVIESVLLFALIVLAGNFPLPVGPNVKTDMTTAVLFGAAIMLEPGAAAIVGASGVLVYTVMQGLPWYKHPFNTAVTALYVGLSSFVFHGLSQGDALISAALIPAAATMYLVNTGLITGVASVQMLLNPFRFWWEGTKENGLAELSLLAYGFLGAVLYDVSPWTALALFPPVVILYVAFSSLGRTNTELAGALKNLNELQGTIANNAKMASIGALYLDMSHQIKNPLAVMIGRLESLEYRLEKDDPNRRHLDIALEAGWRIQELADNFTAMGHKKWVELDVPTLLSEAYGMAGLQNHKALSADWSYDDDLPKVSGNAVLLREGFSNIFANAMDAVGSNGQISTTAYRVNGSVVVRISDDGDGIPDEIAEHLFEPLNTTKEKGSGIGLFAAKHILEMHKGSVEIESKPQRGTSVTLTLPIMAGS
jgi:signal transduction histidine kinase